MEFSQLIQLSYQELLEILLREAPKGTWYDIRDWLNEHYSAEEIGQMYVVFYRALDQLIQDGEGDTITADNLRNNMDVFWYAGDLKVTEQAIRQFHKNQEKSNDVVD
jgi:hypothetical protein